jgi:NAD(P)-dependent dehydrogenase (short-subunit alcohol dehydrogenase family)
VKNLEGSVVVLTGAASGIGRATARAFARQGARLHLVDVDGPGLEPVLEETGAEGHVLDCSDADAVAQLAADVYGKEGRTDVLINNAGVCCGGPVEEISLEDWRWITSINYWGVVNGVHAFVPRMIEQGGGHIVNTASMAGLVGLPYVVPYCATKFAVVGLSEALSAELAHHDIHVTVICPGAVRTGVMENARLVLPGGTHEKLVRGLERWAPVPEKIAAKILAAVRRNRSFVIAGGSMRPLWSLRSLSVGLYQSTARFLTNRALKRIRKT